MKKILSFFAAMLVAVAVFADPVVLPATLDVSNVSFRSDGMPDFVLEEGDYAGTYFDMGAHDNANDTLLYAEWDVTIEPLKYDIDVVVYNENSWRVQLYLLNQAGDTVKDLRYKGSSGQCGKYAIGSMDLKDLEAGNYKLRARAATAWSKMKLKEVIVKADYKGAPVALPGTLLPAYAELSANASVTNDAIAFKPSTANSEYATWNVSFAKAGEFNVTIDITASNGHTYGVTLLSADGQTEIGAVAEAQSWDTGIKELGAIKVPAAGKYIAKLTNATQWSEAVLNSITFVAPPEPQTLYLNLTSSADWAGYTKNFAVYYFDETKNGWSDMMTAVPEKENIYTTTIPAGFSKVIFVRFKSDATTPRWDEYNDEWYVWSQTINLEIPEGKDQFTVDGGNSGKDCTGSWSKYGETPQPEEIKYYLVGNFNGWTASDEYLFEASESEDGQFELAVTLAEYDEFKVKSSKNVWYPDGNENNYKVDANHAGDKTVLFRPDGEGGEGWYEGVIYVEANPVVLEAPDAAPAAPTSEAYQVKAVYSAKYSADCSFGYWESGTQYKQEEFGKKFVTAASGYFGLEFSSHLDCSEMEALHLDAWIAEDASIHVVPIHGGAEVGVTVNLKGQQWNSIDIDLKKFEGVTNWSNVYQIKIDEAANLTFWLNNVYFYTTQTKTIDLVDGYYLIGTMNSWDIHNMTAADKFAVNPENDKEYKLTTTLAENDEFKVVEVANNAIVEGKWFPAEAGNYKVDFDHSGENKDIYFRPDYEGGEGWHAGCIFVAESVGNNPWTTYFAVGDTWNEEKESYLEWDADNEKATIHIAVDKNGQWRAQAKYRGLIAEAGKYYRVSLKMKANNAIQNVTIKYQDNDQAGAEMVLVTDAALEAGVEFVFDRKVAGTDGGNGIMVLDFGFAKAGDIIEIYDVVIEEVYAKFYIAGNMTSWGDNKIPVFEDSYILEDLAAGKYQMKVVDGADWLGIKALTATADNLYIDQDGNICFILAEAGDVTVTFKKIEDEISAFTVTGNFVAPEIKLIGIKGWEEDTDAIAFESGTTEASVKLTLDGDWYDFKLIRAGEWLGKENEGEQNYRIHSEYNFVDGLVRNYEGLKSISLQPDGAGVYEFVYEYATGKLQVNFPQEDPSAIENSEVAVKVQKLIENGQIVIIRNGEKFNAQGQLIR